MRNEIHAILNDIDTDAGLDACQRAIVAAALARHLTPQAKTGVASPDTAEGSLYTVQIAATSQFHGGPSGWGAVFGGGEEFSGGVESASYEGICLKAMTEALLATEAGSTIVILASQSLYETMKRLPSGKKTSAAYLELQRLQSERDVLFHSVEPNSSFDRASALAKIAALANAQKTDIAA
jgi:hypothetical protein